ncbi:ras-related protein Rab-40B [Papio anubis]|nr:ras-related protein Rab-40B [Papio anubis]
MSALGSPVRAYDFLLKFLLVGDSDVGKGEILASLQDGAAESPYGHPAGIDYKTTTILLDGRRVKLQLWSPREHPHPTTVGTAPGELPHPTTTGTAPGEHPQPQLHQAFSEGGSVSPSALAGPAAQLQASHPVCSQVPAPRALAGPALELPQGVILVYDIANRWSFDGIDRWIKEIDEHAPGVPKILVGNRLHLAFKRQVPTEQAQAYAERLGVTFFEVSPLCNFNITESFTELARIVLLRHGMDRLWRPSKVLSLQDLCCRAVVSCTPVHLVDKLPLPIALRSHLKSFSMANGLNARMMHGRSYSLTTSSTHKRSSLRKVKLVRPPQSPPKNCTRNSCKIS